jgi:DNA mismatch repair protein MutL
VLSIRIPPGELDVNVHPSKAQVKFANEQVVFKAVRDAVRAALSGSAAATSALHRYAAPPEGQQADWAVAEPELQPADSTPTVEAAAPQASAALPPLRILGQVLSTYLVAEGPDGLYLIDLHAAHERVVFESLLEQQKTRRAESQGLLAPLTLEASPVEAATLAELTGMLAEVGFALEPFGSRTYLLRAVPAALGDVDPISTLRDVLQELSGDSRGTTQERLAASVACHSAVRGGQQLSPLEMRQLVQQLEACAQPRTCPHGRPTVIHFSTGHLERLFGRRL